MTRKIGLEPHSQARTNIAFVLAYLFLYAVFLALLHRFEHFDLAEALFVLGILGIVFPLLAWWITGSAVPLLIGVRNPARETVIVFAYLVATAAFITWGLSAIRVWVPTEPGRSLAIVGAKLMVFVLIPAALFRAQGYSMRELVGMPSQWRQHLRPAVWMALALILFQAVFGRGLSDIRHSGLPAWALLLGIPFTYVWLVVEVGLVEEFFFRCLLQSRLSSALRSEGGGIMLASLLFGLAHAPGLYFRPATTQEAVGAHPSWLMAVGYSIVITSVAGLFLGVLWSRTKNLLVVVLVHAAGDWLPNLVPTVKDLL